jgi:hypothetical protein
MTVEHPETVLDLLTEDPRLRCYQYRHAQTGTTLYALFPEGQHDDMDASPQVREWVLLYNNGVFTAAGEAWRVAQHKEDVR